MDPTGTCREVGQGCAAGLASCHCAGCLFVIIMITIASVLLFLTLSHLISYTSSWLYLFSSGKNEVRPPSLPGPLRLGGEEAAGNRHFQGSQVINICLIIYICSYSSIHCYGGIFVWLCLKASWMCNCQVQKYFPPRSQYMAMCADMVAKDLHLE